MDTGLLCPICRGKLSGERSALTCPNQHHFDRARAGYVNLLQIKKRPKLMGDDREMLRARREFLSQNHYAPLMSGISGIVARHRDQWQQKQRDSKAGYTLIDIGCGEGSYLAHVAHELGEHHGNLNFLGMDIAKEAARLTARRCRFAHIFVADVKNPLLLADESMNAILNIFAPRNPDEFARVLHEAGLLLIVIPAEEHLAGLHSQSQWLNIQANKRAHVVGQMSAAGLELFEQQSLSFNLRLTPPGLMNLIQMSPSYRRISMNSEMPPRPEGFPEAITASFLLLMFRKQSTAKRRRK